MALAADYLEDGESAVVLMGDDFMYNADGSSEVARLLAATPDGQCSLLAQEVPGDDISRYGAIVIDEAGNFVEIVEKPKPEEAPSHFANIGKYVLTKKVIQSCADVEISPRGEYELIGQGGVKPTDPSQTTNGSYGQPGSQHASDKTRTQEGNSPDRRLRSQMLC